MDVARFKYPPHWVALPLLFEVGVRPLVLFVWCTC